ncbi:MAG: hypothetical protein HYU41_07475 [Candidatus Rokubacteria bacterium]|nr:hypothetical protein [Candidatus Rokubacteria bacterium]
MNIALVEHPTVDHPRRWEVRKGTLLIGHARQDADGMYRYFHGPDNASTSSIEAPDLDRLLVLLIARHGV